MELFRVLGRHGLLGVGIGMLGRSSPYVGGGTGVFRAFPAVTWSGSRLQWFGPSLRYGLLGNDRLRLAATARYRLRPYEEDDDPALAGLGDREDTLLAGLALVSELPGGVNLALGYEQDVLDRIGGGSASLEATRSFQAGIVRLTPSLGTNWVGDDLANHDFGVELSAARPGRPAYDVGDYASVSAGLGSIVELSRHWRIVLDVTAELLPSAVTDSPIVESDVVFQGFAALTYTF
jgi:outer membrane protein